MAFGECKVYSDGSHYIAIPYQPNKAIRRPKPPEELITVVEESPVVEKEEGVEDISQPLEETEVFDNEEDIFGEDDKSVNVKKDKPKYGRKMTRKDLFEELYEESKNMKKKSRIEFITNKMQAYFKNYEAAKTFVENNFERKKRNTIEKRKRLTRKLNLASCNYFITYTYDDKKHTEHTFRTKLRTCLRHLVERKGWKYVGVWERGAETNRLHFHGIFEVPEGAMPGEIKEFNDYDTRNHRMQKTWQNTYFNEKFGRTDCEEIEHKSRIGEAIAYLTKYIEKTGEKLVYSKNLPQYFVSDIMDHDIVCRTGIEGRKLLLFDDFQCWDQGCLMGVVSPEVISQMPKCN